MFTHGLHQMGLELPVSESWVTLPAPFTFCGGAFTKASFRSIARLGGGARMRTGPPNVTDTHVKEIMKYEEEKA